MKNLVILIIFLIVLNTLTGLVITIAKIQEQSIIDDQVDLYAQNMEIQANDMVDSGFTPATQSEYSTDLMPPIDANEAGISTINILKNSVWMDIPDDMYDTQVEQYLITWIKWIIYLLRIVCGAWAFILIYAKVVHQ